MHVTKLKRIISAIVLGTFAMFLWGGLSHMVLLVGTGFNRLPDEEIVLTTLREHIPEQGLYFFPGKNFNNTNAKQEQEWNLKFQTGPTGILIYRPIGGDPFAVSKLAIQFFSNLFAVTLAMLFVLAMNAGYWRKVLLVTSLGLTAGAAASSIYWNWYEFPSVFFVAQLFDMSVGFFFAGLIIAKVNFDGVNKKNIESEGSTS